MDTVAGNGVLRNALPSEPYKRVVTIGLIFKFFNIIHINVTITNILKLFPLLQFYRILLKLDHQMLFGILHCTMYMYKVSGRSQSRILCNFNLSRK
jgi:hypothetical protein